jgi:hypothetical protein
MRFVSKRVLALATLGFLAATICYAASIVERRGHNVWISVNEHTPWLQRGVRLALHRPAPIDTPGDLHWRTIAAGFEAAQLPVLVGREEADRIYLARIDPRRYRFELRNDPGGRTDLDAWMHRTNAALIVNGSYFAPDGTPATPVVMEGVLTGPAKYSAAHGAFVSSPQHTDIRDLAHGNWQRLLQGAETGFVSYPLLIARDGSTRAQTDTGWLANRSFIAEDENGRVIIGTTQGAFFTLPRLADFLRRSALHLRYALNLDGGPVACQGIAIGAYRRTTYGHEEVQVDANGRATILPDALPGANLRHASMPIVLAVYPRDDARK